LALLAHLSARIDSLALLHGATGVEWYQAETMMSAAREIPPDEK